MLSWNRFSTSSRRGDLKKPMANIASECRSANIVRDHALILPDDANPKPDRISETTARIARRNRAKSSRSRALELDAPLSAFLCVRSWFSLEKPYEKPQLFGLQSLQVSHRL